MAFRLLLDENLEHELRHRLESLGHDVEHVDEARELGKGAEDETIVRYAADTDRILCTHDDDFVTGPVPTDSSGIVFLPDQTMSSREIATALDAVAATYPQSAIEGVETVGREWL